MQTYEVSIDPYDNGARVSFRVRAKNARHARRIARTHAERDGWMRAAWRDVQCARIT